MAKLVEVYRNDGKDLLRRQLPLAVEENLVFVMELGSKGLLDWGGVSVPSKELSKFISLFNSLTEEELSAALTVDHKELSQVLDHNVNCIGCRRSVERLFWQLCNSGHPALDPLCITCDGVITIDPEYYLLPKVIFSLFYRYSGRLSEIVENGVRGKKKARCVLHSLDSGARVRAPWIDVWNCMKQQVKDEVVLIDASFLMSTLENYLHKHRFCGECRTKVLRAYWLLVEEEEPSKEKGFVPRLYAGIKRCLPDSHVHLPTRTDYIAALIGRVQPDISATGGERHAKTLEIAQGEVITCLGLCVYERLHRIQLRLREEEYTCQVLALVALETLYTKFQVAIERKRGISTLEILCNELKQEELIKQQRKELKKLKRKKRKERKAVLENKKSQQIEEGRGSCQNSICLVDEEELKKLDLLRHSESVEFCKDCGEDKKTAISLGSEAEDTADKEDSPIQSPHPTTKDVERSLSSLCESLKHLAEEAERDGVGGGQDGGYSSGGHHGASSHSCSPDHSDTPCCDETCNDEGLYNGVTTLGQKVISKKCHENPESVNGFTCSLQDMLEDSCSSDEESYIPIEDVKKFQSQRNIPQQREELRRNLRIKFAEWSSKKTLLQK